MPDEVVSYVNVRPQHDDAGLAELAASMRARGQTALKVRKSKLQGVKGLGFLERFQLTHLSIDGVKAGLASVGKVEGLTTLQLFALRKLDLGFLADIPALEDLHLNHVEVTRFPSTRLPMLRRLTLWSCANLGDLEFLSRMPALEVLVVEGSADTTAFPSLAHCPSLRTLTISDAPELTSLAGVAAAPALRHLVVQATPALPVDQLRFCLDHPTLEWVYPALEPVQGAARTQAAVELLAPRFGADLMDRDRPI